MESPHRRVLIIGSGPAGYTAAIYMARAGLEPLMLAGLNFGGQLMITTDVENYPGYPDGVTGPQMMEEFQKQAERFGTELLFEDATSVDFSERPFKVTTAGKNYTADAVVVATGASARWLGLPSEEKFVNLGVSACATCDGALFRNKPMAVVGGGDTAMEEALFLTRYGKRVTVVHRREELRASKIMADRAQANEKIEFLWNSVVEEVLGDGTKVQSMRVKNVKTGEVTDRSCEGFFVAIGHRPNTELFRDLLPTDDQGYLTPGKGSFTELEGVFMAGDVHDHHYRQAVTAAAAGCMAAIDCERWLEQHGS